MQTKTMFEMKKVPLLVVGLTVALFAVFAVATVPVARAAFGIEAFDQQITADAAGSPFTQAGGHPYAITTEISLNSHIEPGIGAPTPDANVKDIITELPPGLFGNPAGIPQCTVTQLLGSSARYLEKTGSGTVTPECPISSQVGTIEVRTVVQNIFPGSWVFPLYNMVPPTNQPAEFGFNLNGALVLLTGNVRNGGDFGVIVGSNDIPITLPLDGITLTFWGNPADPSHDAQRCDWASFGLTKPETGKYREATCKTDLAGTEWGPNQDPESPRAFLTAPVSCGAPDEAFRTVLKADSWSNPGVFAEEELVNHLPPGFPLARSEWGPLQGMTDCERIPFNPSIVVKPSNEEADTPAGLSVGFKLPQEGLLSPDGVSTSSVKKTVVTLPAGVALSPSAAQGLGACSPGEIGLNTGEPAQCPDSSKLGTLEIDTPLLTTPLLGSVYLAEQGNNPFGSLVAIYLVAEGHGVVLKLAGKIELDPVTGRVKTIVENSPQLPFSDLKIDFNGGARAPLVNPHACGTYETTAELTPWSGNPPVTVSSAFQITSGPEGKPCPTNTQQGFSPSFVAGTTNNQAGAFSPMTVMFSRGDGEQQLGGLVVKTPPGLLGSLSAVSLCPEPTASDGSCPVSSEIGSLTVGAGAGASPFYVTGGKMFLTGPYKGAPFGLSVVVPAKAGPFDLGTVVVRGAVSVDPTTAALTVTIDTLPTILDGIPLDLRIVNVNIGKSGFIFNPTNCSPLSLSGTLTGGLGTTDSFLDSFQVTNCGALGFKPAFGVSTSGKTSRAKGASLDVKLAYPAGSMGTQSNLAKVKVALPKQLPSRLTTLQKACPDQVFNENPAACPAASRVGQATATTPIIPVALSGPAYFVSHGGEKFPELIIALMGYNVTVYLHGETFISKTGITSSTFRTIPDVPIDKFELKLPQGPNSALAANGNLCASKLTMPTAFVAQDGAEIHQSTPVRATGCPHHKAKTKHKHKKGENKKGKKK